VRTFWTLTLTPGAAAPLASVTVPEIEPVTVWLRAAEVNVKQINVARKKRKARTSMAGYRGSNPGAAYP